MTEKQFIQLVKKVARTAKPSEYFRVTGKERLLERIEKRTNPSWAFNWQKWIAGMATVTMLVFILGPLTSDKAEAYVGEARVLQGEITIESGAKIRTVREAVKLQVGDIVSVGSNSEAEVNFVDESKSHLTPGTILRINEALINTSNIKNSIIRLRLEQGEITSQVDKENGQLAQLQIETPTSLIEATNSDFTVKVGSTGETEVTSTKNAVKVKAVQEDKQYKTKKVLAEAQAVEGYTVKVTKEKQNTSTLPLEIIQEESSDPIDEVDEINTNGGSATRPGKLETSIIGSTYTLNANQQSLLESHLQIAQVKIYQAIDALNSNDTNEALVSLRDYQNKLVQAYNLITGEARSISLDSRELATVLADSFLSELETSIASIEDQALAEQVRNTLGSLALLERSLEEKAVLASITLFAPLNTAEEVKQGTEDVEETPKIPVRQTVNTSITSSVNRVKHLIELKNGLSADNQIQTDQVIYGEMSFIANHINAITDWGQQQQETRKILSLFPNNELYHSALIALRSQLLDRIQFIVTNKINRLQ